MGPRKRLLGYSGLPKGFDAEGCSWVGLKPESERESPKVKIVEMSDQTNEAAVGEGTAGEMTALGKSTLAGAVVVSLTASVGVDGSCGR